MIKYRGRLITLLPIQCGFISLKSVTKKLGSPHQLDTTKDIFVHQEDCSAPLNEGMQLVFGVVPDEHRGGDTLRAVEAEEDMTPLAPAPEEPEGVEEEVVHEVTQAAPEPEPAKVVEEETPPTPATSAPSAIEEQVRLNDPMSAVARSVTTLAVEEVVMHMMQQHFSHITYFGKELAFDAKEHQIDEFLDSLVREQNNLGMSAQTDRLQKEFADFKNVRGRLRTTLEFMLAQGILNSGTILPLKYLPDLMMAAPVWYFSCGFWATRTANQQASQGNPAIHKIVKHFCDLFPQKYPTQPWTDTLLMFNRRLRSIAQYNAEDIPPDVVRIMRKAQEVFNYVVLMTPYLNEPGPGWEYSAPTRALNPYIVGFKNDVPLMFLLGRSKEQNVYAGYEELVGNTISFLQNNVPPLQQLFAVRKEKKEEWSGNWYFPNTNYASCRSVDQQFLSQSQSILSAFANKKLFDWLRGTYTLPNQVKEQT